MNHCLISTIGKGEIKGGCRAWRSECDHLHNPCAGPSRRRRRAVAADCRDHLILGNVGGRGQQASREAAARTCGVVLNIVGTKDQIRRVGCRRRTAVGCRAIAAACRRHIDWIVQIGPLIFQNANVGKGYGAGKRHGDRVGPCGGSRDVTGVIDGLGLHACLDRRDSKLIGVAARIRHGSNCGRTVTPSDDNNIEVASGLGRRIRNSHRRLRIWYSIVALHIGDRRPRRRRIYS